MKPGVSILRGLRQAIRWARGERVPVRMYAALADPPEPSPTLKAAAERYKALGMLREVVKR